MFEVTDEAREAIAARLQEAGRPGLALRVEIVGRRPDGFEYRLWFVSEGNRREDDAVSDADGVQVFMDPYSARYLEGARLQYVEMEEQTGFTIDNPNPLWFDPLGPVVHEVVEQRVNPGVALHGGRVTVLDVRDGVAYVAMGGGCQGCGLAKMTLKMGVETMIKEAVPEIREVVDTTEHAAGDNPYYRSPQTGSSPLAKAP